MLSGFRGLGGSKNVARVDLGQKHPCAGAVGAFGEGIADQAKKAPDPKQAHKNGTSD
jgi:hypothetical protein